MTGLAGSAGAITEYLVDKYGNGRLIPPSGTKERLSYKYWLHYAEGSAMPLVVLTLVFSKLRSQAPFFIRPLAALLSNAVMSGYVTPNTNKNIKFLNSTLEKQTWFAGNEFTAADIILRHAHHSLKQFLATGIKVPSSATPLLPLPVVIMPTIPVPLLLKGLMHRR